VKKNIKYWDEDWWREFFTKDFAEFYSSLKGLLNARSALLSELSGDLAQVLADPNKRDLALRILLGGVKDECVEQGKIERDCREGLSHLAQRRTSTGMCLGLG